MRFSKEYIKKKYKILPEIIKDFMGSDEIVDILKFITSKHQLHVDTAGILNDEITYVTVGAEKATDFIRNLKVQLKLPDEKINAIAKDVNEKIFLPIRESLKKVEDASPVESTVEQKQKEIHHPSLSEKPHLETEFPSESDEIKKQIAQQQAVKPAVAPPPNLPTQSDSPIGDTSAGAEAMADKAGEQTGTPIEPKDGQQKPHFEEKKPAHVDPYREPIK